MATIDYNFKPPFVHLSLENLQILFGTSQISEQKPCNQLWMTPLEPSNGVIRNSCIDSLKIQCDIFLSKLDYKSLQFQYNDINRNHLFWPNFAPLQFRKRGVFWEFQNSFCLQGVNGVSTSPSQLVSITRLRLRSVSWHQGQRLFLLFRSGCQTAI